MRHLSDGAAGELLTGTNCWPFFNVMLLRACVFPQCWFKQRLYGYHEGPRRARCGDSMLPVLALLVGG